MADRIVMDPGWAVSGRPELDITPWIRPEGVDYGDAAMEPYKAQATYGEPVIDHRIPNRVMTVPLVPKDAGGTAFATIRSLIQAKAALWQREGGMLGRENGQGTAAAAVVAAGLDLGGDYMQATRAADPSAVLELEALPGWEEPEVELSSHEEKTATELIFTEATIEGDMPCPVRVLVEEKQGQDQKGLVWAFRSRYYSSADTARTAYRATELQPLGASSAAGVTGASGGTAVRNASLPTDWGPIVGTNFGGTGFLTHRGEHRLMARLRSPQGTAVAARFVWDVGDLTSPTFNPSWTFPGGSAWYVADLGPVSLQPPPVGTHRWQGQLQSKGSQYAGGEELQVDKIWLVNCDDGMGVLSAPAQAFSSLVVPVGSDNFNTTTAGTLTGKVAPVGGTWSGTGDAVGFTVFIDPEEEKTRWVTREEKSDADLNTGYYARLGTGTAKAVDASVDVFATGNPKPPVSARAGLFVRYTNASNWLAVVYEWYAAEQEEPKLRVLKRVSGTVTEIASVVLPSLPQGGYIFVWRRLRVTVTAAGELVVYEGDVRDGDPSFVLSATDSALASGGALESGGYGIYDAYTGSEAGQVRRYDNFSASPAPTADAVVYASQKAQLTTSGMYRLDTAGGAYGPVARVIGDLPRIPPTAGGRTTEVFIKTSRGDLGQLPDSGIDDIAAKVFYKPTWLTFPSG